jgi:hypothetical protein
MEVLPDAMVPVCSPAVVQLSNKASISALENPSTAHCRIHLGRRRSEVARASAQAEPWRKRDVRRSTKPAPMTKSPPQSQPRAVELTGRSPIAELRSAMRSILLVLLGVPLPIILLLAFCTHHF